MLGVAWQVSAEVLGGMALGWLYDQWEGEGSTGVLVGAIAGIGVGLWTLVRGSMRVLNQLEHPGEKARRGEDADRKGGA